MKINTLDTNSNNVSISLKAHKELNNLLPKIIFTLTDSLVDIVDDKEVDIKIASRIPDYIEELKNILYKVENNIPLNKPNADGTNDKYIHNMGKNVDGIATDLPEYFSKEPYCLQTQKIKELVSTIMNNIHKYEDVEKEMYIHQTQTANQQINPYRIMLEQISNMGSSPHTTIN